MKIAALIVAGGHGERFSAQKPKQYTNAILTQTIQKFISCKLIDCIQVVIREQDIGLYNEAISGLVLRPYAIGGETRGDSVRNGLVALKVESPDLVLVHDACRPFVTMQLIEAIIEELKQGSNRGVVPALKINETIKKIANNQVKFVDRDEVIVLQTPQGFYFKQLLDIKLQSDKLFTDESTLAELHDVPIKYIEGDKRNIKITYQDDLPLEVRTGIGFDAHKFNEVESINNYIVLGGVKIQHLKSLEAHSDGDVLIHALVDAILGAIGEGDIGLHFSPSSQKWQNADSKLFLDYANNLLKQKNGYINNIDLTVICEAPRVGKYREAIKENVAFILDISSARINIKATTTETMGFTGRQEGIAVQAIATISMACINLK